MQRDQFRISDAIPALELTHDELRVHPERNLVSAQTKRRFQRGDGALVFRLVVGSVAERPTTGMQFGA